MPFWAVARTLARRESFAAERLEMGGFESFIPKTKTGNRVEPLFANYVFVRIADQWRRVDRTLGVIGLVKFGELPAKCPDAEIARLRSQVDESGLVRLPAKPPLRRGAIVKISTGHFAGRIGLYAGASVHQREIVLLAMLGRQTRVEISAGLVVPSP